MIGLKERAYHKRKYALICIPAKCCGEERHDVLWIELRTTWIHFYFYTIVLFFIFCPFLYSQGNAVMSQVRRCLLEITCCLTSVGGGGRLR